MGGSGALLFSNLADRVLALAPQIDLPSYEPLIHLINKVPSEMQQVNSASHSIILQEFKKKLLESVSKCPSVNVHIGALDFDQKQASHLPKNVKVTKHKFAQTHNLGAYLKQQGKLVPLIQEELHQLSNASKKE